MNGTPEGWHEEYGADRASRIRALMEIDAPLALVLSEELRRLRKVVYFLQDAHGLRQITKEEAAQIEAEGAHGDAHRPEDFGL